MADISIIESWGTEANPQNDCAPDDFWATFGDGGDFEEIECDFSGNLATDVLNYYGISTKNVKGRNLSNLDIKQMDALTVIKLSLLHESVEQDSLLELYMNEDGEVEFKETGEYSGSITDIYSTIQTMNYKEECVGVMVTGGKPLTYRKEIEWKPIWGNTKYIFDTDQMNNSACVSDVFNQWVSIVFNDPHLDSAFEDGIDNLYEINKDNPYDNIIGYAYYCNPPKDLLSEDTDITLVKECSIPILVQDGVDSPKVGVLQKLPVTPENLEDSSCWSSLGVDGDPNHGISVIVPEKFRFEYLKNTQIDKFKSVSKVYIIGQEISKYEVLSKSEVDSISDTVLDTQCKIYVSIDDTSIKSFLLEEGKHYVTSYNVDSSKIQIVFADNSLSSNPAIFGDDVDFYIEPTCAYAIEKGIGWEAEIQDNRCILPTSRDSGILVHQIWMVIDIESWAITIHDNAGFAKEIANELKFGILPLVEVDEPAPVAFNGSLLNLTGSIKDHDPTTAQSFEDTEFESALEEMAGGGGLTLNLSFLDENEVETLSDVLYDYMNSGDGQETTYVCGPNCEPKLGGKGPNGGIVNSITYSYSDSSSYTISVNEGQKIQADFAQISGGATMKISEEVSAKGTIIEDMGNNIHYKVRIDGFGERFAMNSSPEVLRVGDKVSCSLHNVPVEA